ncbi:MAG: sigma-70 family RNA polymerase sigma factor [Planctomycetes bacterium]|nr:sigma-70 family RNA polymerase sigma factor [Planctomycetota bacterium]
MTALASTALPFELQSVVENVRATRTADDQQWILSLLDRQGPLVVGLLWRMLGSEQDALDAYQSTVCRLISQGKEAIGTNRDGYFYRAAMNAGIEMLRTRQRRQKHWPAIADFWQRSHDDDSRPPVDSHCGEDVGRLRAAITELPPHLRDVIVLRELAGLPYRQVASLLKIGTATARLYRHQAVLRLADMLGARAA